MYNWVYNYLYCGAKRVSMKYIILIAFALGINLKLYANEKAFFQLIDTYVKSQKKPTLVYFDLQWCKASVESIEDKKALLKEFENCYSILIFTSDLSRNLFTDFNVDSFVDVGAYFPLRLSSFKERRKLAKIVSKYYQVKTKQYYFAPSAFNIFRNDEFYFFNYYLQGNYRNYTCKNL